MVLEKVSALKRLNSAKFVMFVVFAVVAMMATEIRAEMKDSKSGNMMMGNEKNMAMGDEKGVQTVMVDGVKGVFKFTPAYSMVDIVLTDMSTGKQITEGKVSVDVTNPKGKSQKKDLVFGKMGEKSSFMNTLDTSEKGSYKIMANVHLNGKNISYPFDFEVK